MYRGKLRGDELSRWDIVEAGHSEILGNAEIAVTRSFNNSNCQPIARRQDSGGSKVLFQETFACDSTAFFVGPVPFPNSHGNVSPPDRERQVRRNPKSVEFVAAVFYTVSVNIPTVSFPPNLKVTIANLL